MKNNNNNDINDHIDSGTDGQDGLPYESHLLNRFSEENGHFDSVYTDAQGQNVDLWDEYSRASRAFVYDQRNDTSDEDSKLSTISEYVDSQPDVNPTVVWPLGFNVDRFEGGNSCTIVFSEITLEATDLLGQNDTEESTDSHDV